MSPLKITEIINFNQLSSELITLLNKQQPATGNNNLGIIIDVVIKMPNKESLNVLIRINYYII